MTPEQRDTLTAMLHEAETSAANWRKHIHEASWAEGQAAECESRADALRAALRSRPAPPDDLVALRLVLKCAERACDADNLDAATDYVREALRHIDKPAPVAAPTPIEEGPGPALPLRAMHSSYPGGVDGDCDPDDVEDLDYSGGGR